MVWWKRRHSVRSGIRTAATITHASASIFRLVPGQNLAAAGGGKHSLFAGTIFLGRPFQLEFRNRLADLEFAAARWTHLALPGIAAAHPADIIF